MERDTGRFGFRVRAQPAALAAAASFVALIAIWLTMWQLSGTNLGFFRPADDAFYYYDLSQSVWQGQGLSTDGLRMTNGFHPLWFVVLLPFGGIGGPGSVFLPAAAQVLSMTLFSLAIGLTVASARQASAGTAAALLGGLSLWFAPWRGIAGAGVEGALALSLIAATVLLAFKAVSQATRSRNLVLLGVVGGAAVLARLDTVLVIGPLLLAVSLNQLQGNLHSWSTVRRVVLVLAPPTVVVGAYLVLNTWAFGSPMPITASLKSSFPNPSPPWETIRSFLEYFVALIPPWLATMILRARRSPATVVLLGLALGSSAFAAYIALFGQGIFWWHFVSMMIPAALGIAVIADFILASRPFERFVALRAVLIAGIAVVLAIPLFTSLWERTPDGASVAKSGWRIEMERAAKWAARNLPATSRFGMKDSGAFGYYTDQAVMNLDGVVSDRAFNESLCDGSAFEVAKRDGVRFVVHHAVASDYESFDLRLPCWDRGTTPAVFTFTPADEVYRGEPYWHNGPDRRTIIWRFSLG